MVSPIYVDVNEMSDDEVRLANRYIREATDQFPDACADELFSDAMSRLAALWWIVDETHTVLGAAVTRIAEFRTGYRVWIIEACGKPGRVSKAARENVVRVFEETAIEEGCDAIRICGRRGWGRALEGFVEVSTTFDKVIAKES